MKEEISLDIEMSKEEMAKIKELLTSLPELRHYAFQLKNGEYLDLVEYKDYEKLEEENKSLQSQLKAKEEVIKETRETIKTKLQKSFAYDYGLSGVDATGKDRLFTETVIELQLIDEILSKGENK